MSYRIVSNTGRVLARTNTAASAVALWNEIGDQVNEPVEIEEIEEIEDHE